MLRSTQWYSISSRMGVALGIFLNYLYSCYTFPTHSNARMSDHPSGPWPCPSSPVAVDQDPFPIARLNDRRSPVPRDFDHLHCYAITPTGLCPAHSTQSNSTCSNPDHTASRRWYGQVIFWAWELRRPYQLPNYEIFHPPAQILADPVSCGFLHDALQLFQADVFLLLSGSLPYSSPPTVLDNPLDPMVEDSAAIVAAALVCHCSGSFHDNLQNLQKHQYVRFWHPACECLSQSSLPDSFFW